MRRADRDLGDHRVQQRGWLADKRVFSQSSSIPHEWNIWIIYPVLGLGLIFGIDAWNTFGRKPITEREIRREMDRLSGLR